MTTIWVSMKTKSMLKRLKQHPRETYEDVVRRLIDFYLEHSPAPIRAEREVVKKHE